MKVLLLPSFYPAEMELPRGNFFEEQAVMLLNKGVNISVLYNELRSIKSFSLLKFKKAHFQVESAYENNILVYRKKGWNVVPTKYQLGKLLWIQGTVNLINLYIKEYGKPDLIHAHNAMQAGFVAKQVKDSLAIPYIITEHSTYFSLNDIAENDKQNLLSVYNSANKVICVSNQFKNLLNSKIGSVEKGIDVIPNFIDTAYFSPSEYSLNKLSDDKHIFCVCYHEKKKRLDRLINAFYYVKEKYPKAKLTIGGNGTETKSLKELVNNLDLNESVNFTGFLSKSEVRRFLDIVDLFVLSSDVETFGVVLIEAMSMGVPVISTNSGGPEDIVSASCGILVEKDVHALADAIIRFYDTRDNYDSKKIRKYIVDNFSGEAVANRYIVTYQSALDGDY